MAERGDRFDKFTERARRVLTLAQEEAQRFNHNYIGTEHVLLGLVREGDGIAAKVLGNLGVQLPVVREAVGRIIGRGEAAMMGSIGLTPRSKKVIELAVDEARRLNHNYIGTEHLLLGLVREGEGIAAGVLESLGVSLDKVRAQVIQVVSSAGVVTQAIASEGDDRPSGVHNQAVGMQRRSLAPATPSPLPSELVRVLPLGEAQERNGMTVTLLALEEYRNGFVLTFRLVAGGDAPAVPEASLTLTATDDRGRRHSATPHGGSGGGGDGLYEWRFAYRFTPPLAAGARTLRLELAEGRWRPGVLARAEELSRWTFAIALPGGAEPEQPTPPPAEAG